MLVFDYNSTDGPFTFAYISTTDGSIIYSGQELNYNYYIGGGIQMALVDSNDIVYFAYQGFSSKWQFMSFQYNTTISSLNVISQYSYNFTGSVNYITTANYLEFYLGGTVIDPVTALTSTNMAVMSSNGTLTDFFNYRESPNNPNYYYIRRLFKDSADSYLHMCMEYSTTGYSQFAIFNRQTNTLIKNMKLKQSSQSISCLGVAGSGMVSYFYVSYSNGTNYFLTVNYSTLKYQLSGITPISSTSTIIAQGLIINSSTAYFLGSLRSITDTVVPQTYTKRVAFLLSQQSSSSCLTYSNTTKLLTASFIMNASMSFTTLSISNTTTSNLTTNLVINSIIQAFPLLNSTSMSSSWCNYQKFISAPSSSLLPTETYMLTDPPLYFTVPAYSFGLNCSDLSFTYSTNKLSSTSLPLSMTFYQNRTYIVSSSLPSENAVQHIQYNATANDGSIGTTSFIVNIISPCQGQTIVVPTFTSSFTYAVDDVMYSYVFPDFGISGTCTTLVYNLTKTSNGAVIDPTIFSFSSTSPLNFTIYTQNASAVGTYSLTLSVQIYMSSTIYTHAITVKINASCTTTVLTWSCTYSSFYYDVLNNAAVQLIPASPVCWTQSLSYCPSIQYAWIDSSTNATASPTFFVNTTGAYVQTGQASDVGTYQLYYQASVGSVIANASIKVTIIDCNFTDQINASVNSNYTYVATTGTMTKILTPWSSSLDYSVCGPLSYTKLVCTSSSGANLTGLTLYNATSPYFTLYNNLVLTANVYYCTLSAQVGLMPIPTTSAFTITMTDPCPYANITTTPYHSSNITYYLRQSSLTFTMYTISTNVTVSYCYYTYKLTYASGAAFDGSVFTFSSTANTLKTQSSNYLKAGTYNFTSTLSSINYTWTYVFNFTVDVIDNCTTAIISNFANKTIYYTFPSSSTSTVLTAFTSSVAGCGSFNYTILNQNGSGIDSTLFTFTPASLTLNINSSQTSKNGSYALELIGALPSPYQSILSTSYINLFLNVSCTLTSILSDSISNMTYTIGDALQYQNITEWTETVGACGPFSYSAALNPTLELPSFIEFDYDPMSFQVYSMVPSNAGQYNIVLNGELPNAYSAAQYFTITVVDPCPTALISHPDISSLATYQLRNTTYVIDVGLFNSSVSSSICGAFVYSMAQNYTVTGSTALTLDYTDLDLSIYSESDDDVGVYQISITGYQGTYSGNSLTKTFIVSIVDACPTATITTPSISSLYQYYLKNHTVLSIGGITSSALNMFCGDFVYEVTQNGSSLLSSPFTFDYTLMDLDIYSSDSMETGYYHFEITGFQKLYPLNNQTIQFTVQIIDPCPNSYISVPSVSPLTTYYIKNSSLVIDIGNFVPIEDESKCGSLIYLPTQNGSDLDSSVFQLNLTTMIFTIDTSNSSYVGTWLINILGYQSLYPNHNVSVSFTVVINDPCPTSTITAPPSITSPTIYYIKNATQNISIGQFMSSEDSSKCGDFVYNITQNGSALNTSIFSLDLISMNFSIYSLNPQFVNQWLITLLGYQALYPDNNKSINFTIIVKDPCPNSIVSIDSLPQAISSYYIKNETMNISIGNFSSTESCNKCGDFVYFTYQNGSSLNSSVFSFNSTSMNFTVSTNDSSSVGFWLITIIAYQELEPQNNLTITFTIIIIDPCPIASLTAPSVSIVSPYYILNSTSNIHLGNFTSSESIMKCGDFYYLSTQNGTTFTGSPFTFDTTSMMLTTYASSGPYESTYTINITGWQGAYSSNNVTLSFQIEVIDICKNASITPSSIPNTTYHLLKDSSLILSFASFNISPSFCGTLTYSVALSDLQQIDTSFITFNQSNQSLTINTTDLTKINNYTFLITGSLPSPYPSASFTFTLDINCFNEQINVPLLSSYSYTIAKTQINSIVPSFIQFPACNYQFDYSMTLYDGSPLPSFITYNDSTQEMSIYSTDNSQNGTYKIKVIGSLESDPNYNYKSGIFTVSVNATLYHSGQLPYYSSALVDQSVMVGSSLIYVLPNIVDPNPGCSLTVSASGLTSFITYSNGVLKSRPTQSSQVNTYTITMTLKETIECPYQMSYSYSFIVTVTVKSASSSSNTTSPTSSSSSSSTKTESSTLSIVSSSTLTTQDSSSSIDNTYTTNDESPYASLLGYTTSSKKKGSQAPTITIVYSVEKKNVSTSLQAYISSISLTGLAKVTFTEEVMIPSDFSVLNSSFLNVKYDKSDPDSNVTLNSWNITDFQALYFSMQLNFSDPVLVSQSDVKSYPIYLIALQQKDQLKVTFVSNGCFRTASDNMPISYLYTVEQAIPAQSPESSTSVASGSTGSSIQSASKLILSSNVALQFFLSASLNQLWGMINAMQILTVLPAFTLLFPSNAQEVLTLFLSIAQFQVINPSTLFGKIFKPKLSQSQNVPSNLISIGMNSTNMFMNLGIFLIAIVIICLVVVLTLILKKFAQRNKVLSFVDKKLRPLIFYNFILRPLIEGYLNFCLSTMLASESLSFEGASSIFESIVVLVFSVFIAVFPPLSYVFLKKFSARLREKQFKQKFESLYEGIKTGSEQDNGIFLNPFFLFRRFVLAASIIYITNFIALQLLIQTMVSLYYLQFLIYYKPYEQAKMNYIEIFNESTLLVCFYMCYSFTDLVPDPLQRYFLGKVFIVFILLNIGVNVFGILTAFVSQLKRTITQKCNKRKNQNKVQVLNNKTKSNNLQQTGEVAQYIQQLTQTTKKPINRIELKRLGTANASQIGNTTVYSVNQSIDNMSMDLINSSEDVRMEDYESRYSTALSRLDRENKFIQPTFAYKNHDEKLFKNVFSIYNKQ